MDYEDTSDSIVLNGEPGLAWLDNMKKFARMNGKDPENGDHRAKGGNPCLGKYNLSNPQDFTLSNY